MIDNIKLILPFLKFESKDDFYYLQILQRKKENPEIGSNSRVIKNYYITSEQYLLDRYDEITTMCCMFNARAMIRLNKRSFEKVGFKTMENLAGTMMNRDYDKISKSYDRACGLGHNDSEKKWILDVDKPMSSFELMSLSNFIQTCEPCHKRTILQTIPSKNGFHLICLPFNLSEFSTHAPGIEIHKDNPTNLYIP